jgi:hypothetical protein
MSRYRIVLLSVSKRSLTQALYALQSSVELNYKSNRFLKKKFQYSPLIEVTSTEFKRITRRPIKKTKFSVIKSPFVYKKSGESFIFTYYKAEFNIGLKSSEILSSFKIRGILSFLLKNQCAPAVFSNVELRVISTETNHGLTKKL